METQLSKSMGYSNSCSKRDVHSDTDLFQEIRKSPKNLTLYLKELKKKKKQGPKLVEGRN